MEVPTTSGATADVTATYDETDQTVLVMGKTFCYKDDLKQRFGASWDGDQKAWSIDVLNLQHDDDGVTTPQLLCEWIQVQLDESAQRRLVHKADATAKRKLEREEKQVAKKQKVTHLAAERRRCYANAKTYAVGELDRTFVVDGFYAQCGACDHYLYGMDGEAATPTADYYAKDIVRCWQCDVELSTVSKISKSKQTRKPKLTSTSTQKEAKGETKSESDQEREATATLVALLR